MLRWRGLKDLLVDAVDGSATALERVQKDAAATPFRVLESVPVLAPAARGVHVVHDVWVSAIYAVVRGVTKAVDVTADFAFDVVEARAGTQASSEDTAPRV